MATEPSLSIAQHLIELLKARTGSSSLAYSSPPTRLGGGFSADTYAFEILDPPPMLTGPLVLRLMRNDDDARRETIVHRAVADSGFPAPRIHLAGSAGDAFGRPFLIADFAHGADAVREWGVRRAFRELPSLLAGIMTQLHCLDADSIAEELEAVGWSQDRLGPRGVLTEIEAALDDATDSELRRQLDWLRAERPLTSRRHICHGDLHALNILVRDGRVTSVLDWELARVTDPECDVARTKIILDAVPGMSSALLRPLVQSFGRRAGAAFVQNYRDRRPLDEDRARWWEAAHCLRLVALVAQRRATGHSSASEGVVGIWDPLERSLRRRLNQVMAS